MANVHFHAESEYMFDEVDAQHPGLKQALTNDFKLYIESDFDLRPARFGKVDLYKQPPSLGGLGIWHIHICMPPRPGFSKHLEQSRMVCRKDEPDRDAALVYVQGLIETDDYCLLAMLYPNAHEEARNMRQMLWIGGMARDFRDRF